MESIDLGGRILYYFLGAIIEVSFIGLLAWGRIYIYLDPMGAGKF